MPHNKRTENSKDFWETPFPFFQRLEKKIYELYHREFTIDICATRSNRKCKRFYSKELNGLIQDLQGEVAFCNPPYSEKEKWTKKCYNEGQKQNTIVVILIPSATETIAWHTYCMKADRILLCVGRVQFWLEGKRIKRSGNTIGSAIVIFKQTENKTPIFESFYHNEKDLAILESKQITEFIEG